ncbi:CBL-interacting serine/threonine-protein kinase 23, partial [Mucuna pruriens]
MANSRIARFFMEVAPPQYVTVMRHRTSKMLDTITEDDREISTNDSVISPPKSSTAAAAAAASSAASVTNANGRYELGQTLGRGASSIVRLARHLDTGHNVAIKVFDKNLVLVQEAKHLTQQKMDAIIREISIMKMCQHPNVVRMIEVRRNDCLPVMATKTNIYIVLEHLSGGELYDKVIQSRTSVWGMNEVQARRYFQQLICGLGYCHSNGVSHRDIKPQNLLLDADGVLKVLDFGMSALAPQVRQDGLLHTVCGTPHYTAPEVLSNNGYDGQKADIWSCGVIVFFMVAGYLPFRTDADDNTVSYEKIRHAEFTCPSFFSSRLRRLVKRMLDLNPDTIPEDEEVVSAVPAAMNAFQMFSTYLGFDLIGNLFDRVRVKREARFICESSANEIISGIEHVAGPLGFNVKKRHYQMCIEGGEQAMRRGHLIIIIEIYQMAPSFHMVELRKAGGDVLEFHKFYKGLSSGLQDIINKAEPIDADDYLLLTLFEFLWDH